MEEDPRIRLYTIGAMIQSLKKQFGSRYSTGFGDHDIYKWVKLMPLMLEDVDFFVAPLVDCTYAKGKSGIKYLEYSSTHTPGVYQNIRQYQELITHGENGYLCETEADWYRSMKELCDVKERTRVGEAAYKNVKDNYTIQGNIKQYSEWFKQILT